MNRAERVKKLTWTWASKAEARCGPYADPMEWAAADEPLPEHTISGPAGTGTHFNGHTDAALIAHREAYAKAKVAAERELCAKLCDLHSRLTWNDDRKTQSRVLAAEIRRGEIQVHQKGTV